AEHGQRIGIAPAALLAHFHASGEAYPTGWQFENLPAQVGGEALLLVAAGISRGVEDVIKHLAAQVAIAQVVAAGNSRARHRAADAPVQGLLDTIKIGHIVRAINA